MAIKNTEWCGDLGNDGAACFNTNDEGTRDIPVEIWKEERIGMLCTKAENFAHWQAIILKLCRANRGRCRYEVKQNMIIFMEKVEAYQGRFSDI